MIYLRISFCDNARTQYSKRQVLVSVRLKVQIKVKFISGFRKWKPGVGATVYRCPEESNDGERADYGDRAERTILYIMRPLTVVSYSIIFLIHNETLQLNH